ncbi:MULTISPECIES: HAMP domain-containing sensor histidine kinase [unclassified Lysinibacillus]|uniref:HAMP domain-containing sensor histidine kinase n=1 Tax=unclassified Lysinibacillus TaxID=2636778 RepID=UPI0020130614|nr:MULTISPECIES: HAMP domain-containing sensor histidine kinase [unclassified Lysinibacillus]MCL1696851.1 HAMP domain-containing histidine kinase [Lysinibacillus sp. BPa_S21]MCL1701507.1 HAMP domain-containing histidine kinase [Lysinibacillus sp. Bpr_S20]
MRIKLLSALFLVIFVAGITAPIMMINNKDISEVNIVAINDLVKTVEKNWGQINNETLNNSGFQQPFIIIDNLENVIYQTPGIQFINIYDAIKNRDSIIDVMQNDEVAGKIIIRNNEKDIVQEMKKELVTSFSLIVGLLMIISIIYNVYIYRTLLKPFMQLKHFAADVARGNLDVPLNMNKNNYFGAFTESFDLLREELYAARQREYESNRSKKELVATLSHDIKTPVASIKAVSELMLLQARDEKVMKQVNTIYSKAEQIDLLVTDMFHATLEELQQLQITVIEESSEVLVDMIENVNYDNQIIYDSIPQCIILTDSVRMQQVIDNIISNSYKYAGTKVTIQSQIQQGYLELHIMDFGSGISEEELPLLFNKYYRGTNIGGKNGSGLGLYISKYFMENMCGQISCYNGHDGFIVVLKIKLA